MKDKIKSIKYQIQWKKCSFKREIRRQNTIFSFSKS